jgi:hypothetical protein
MPPTLTPLDYVLLDSGLLAHGTAVLNTENLDGPGGISHEKITAVFLFDRNDFSPEGYARWVETNKYAVENTRQRFLDQWQSLNDAARRQYVEARQGGTRGTSTER